MLKLRGAIGACAVVTTLMYVNNASAARWEFERGVLNGGWVYDQTIPSDFPGQVAGVTFANSSSLIGTRNDGNQRINGQLDKILILRSGNRFDANVPGPNQNKKMQGSGIERPNTFGRRMVSRCRFSPKSFATTTIAKNEQVRRSQGSFWQDVAGPNTLEIDVFEMKPGGNHLNFINWENGRRIPNGTGPRSSKTHLIDTPLNAIKWARYACNTSNNRNDYTCTRNRSGAPVFTRQFTKLRNSVSGQTVILHNKPWRISQSNLSFGPVANLQCDFVAN